MIILTILVLCQFTSTTTIVSKDIVVDAIFGKSYSPYEIINNVRVLEGVSLTVEEGVTVLFCQTCKLYVFGDLFLEGSSNQEIVMEKLGNPDSYKSCGIYLYKSHSIRHTIFRNLNKAIVAMGDLVVENCVFEDCLFGVDFCMELSVAQTRFESIEHAAIMNYECESLTVHSISILDSEFIDCDVEGIKILSVDEDDMFHDAEINITISNNNFRNSKKPIFIELPSNSFQIDDKGPVFAVTLKNNNFSCNVYEDWSNLFFSLYNPRGSIVIEENIFFRNIGIIRVIANVTKITKNVFEDNTYFGFDLDEDVYSNRDIPSSFLVLGSSSIENMNHNKNLEVTRNHFFNNYIITGVLREWDTLRGKSDHTRDINEEKLHHFLEIRYIENVEIHYNNFDNMDIEVAIRNFTFDEFNYEVFVNQEEYFIIPQVNLTHNFWGGQNPFERVLDGHIVSSYRVSAYIPDLYSSPVSDLSFKGEMCTIQNCVDCSGIGECISGYFCVCEEGFETVSGGDCYNWWYDDDEDDNDDDTDDFQEEEEKGGFIEWIKELELHYQLLLAFGVVMVLFCIGWFVVCSCGGIVISCVCGYRLAYSAAVEGETDEKGGEGDDDEDNGEGDLGLQEEEMEEVFLDKNLNVPKSVSFLKDPVISMF